MKTKSCLKIASSVLVLGILLYWVPAIMTGENVHSTLSLRIGSNTIYPDEPLTLSFDIDAIPLRTSGYVVFVAPGGEAYSLRADGSFVQGIHPIVTDEGPMDKPMTMDVTAAPSQTLETGLYKVYAALVRDNAEPLSGEYLGFDSGEFNVREEEIGAEEVVAEPGKLTITTYNGDNEGHLITFPGGTTMSIDCAAGAKTTKSHFHDDHCGACGEGQYNRNNVVPGDVIYDENGVTVTVVAANGRVIGEERPPYISCCSSTENKNSMALWVKYGGFDYLTTGDLYGDVEGPLGIALKKRGVNVDVLKVSHHGTCTNGSSSLSYLNNIKPEYVTICGTKTTPCGATSCNNIIPNLIAARVQRIYCIPDYNLSCLGSVPPEVCNGNGTTTITTDGCAYSIVGRQCSDLGIPVDEPTATPAPAMIVLSNPAPKIGDNFEAWFKLCESIERPFTAFAVIAMPNGKIINALTLDTPLKPVATNVRGLSAPFTYPLISTTVPKYAPKGTYELAVAFFDPGKPIRSREGAFLDVSASFTIAE